MGLVKRAMWKEDEGGGREGITRTIEAAEAGDEQALRDAVARGVDLNAADPEDELKSTALMQAAAAGQLGVIKLLINDLQVDRHRRDARGANCLHYAADGGHGKVILWLVGDGKMDIAAADNEGQLASHYAAKRAHSAVLDTIRSLSPKAINTPDKRGVTPLMRLVEASDDARLVTRIVKHGADVNAVDDQGETALMYAARKNNANVCSELIVVHKADAGQENAAGKTAMAIAEEHGNSMALNVLVNGGMGAQGASGWKRERKEVDRLDSATLWEAGIPKKRPNTTAKEAPHKARDTKGEIPAGVPREVFERFKRMGRERRPVHCGHCKHCRRPSMRKACMLMRYFGDTQHVPRVKGYSQSSFSQKKKKDSKAKKQVSTNGSPAGEEPSESMDIQAPLTAEQELAQRFFVAAEDGDSRTVRRMLDEGFDVNRGDDTNEGTTALMYAALRGQLGLVDELIVKRGADTHVVDVNGTTVLMCAAQGGFVDLIKCLCSDTDAEVDFSDDSEMTDEDDSRQVPLSKVRGHAMDPNMKNNDGDTALHFAAQHGHREAVQMLLSFGADPRLTNNDGETALVTADKERHRAISRDLREAMRNPVSNSEERNSGGTDQGRMAARTPRQQPSQRKVIESVASKLPSVLNGATFGATVSDSEESSKSPRPTALNPDGSSMTPENVREARRLTVSLTSQEKQFLRMMSRRNRGEARRLVQEAGVSVETCNEEGTTALMIVCMDGDKEMFDFLVNELHANPNAMDLNGMTVLMHAAQEGHVDLAKALIEDHDAEVNACTDDGDTALMYAAQAGHVDTLKLLVSHGANLDAEDKDGQTALMLAAEGGHVNVISYLLEKGAKIKPEWLVSLAS